jgi:hypothetical protein
MTRDQANQLIQSTIDALQPIQRTVEDTMGKVNQQSAELGTKAVDRMGTIALWLAIVPIITLALSALGGRWDFPKSPYSKHAAPARRSAICAGQADS